MNGENEGYATLSVLVFLALVLPLVVTFANEARVSASSASARNEVFRFRLLAEGIANAYADRIADRAQIPETDFSPGGDASCSIDDHLLSFHLVDHGGKIALNTAGPELLRAGFSAAGFTAGDADALTDFVVAARQKDAASGSLPRLSGMPIKHAPFERVAEINDAIAALKLRPVDLDRFFTVFRSEQTIDPRHAEENLKEMLTSDPGLSQFLVKGDAIPVFDLEVVGRAAAGSRWQALRITFAKGDRGVNILDENSLKDWGPSGSSPSVSMTNSPISCETLLTGKEQGDG